MKIRCLKCNDIIESKDLHDCISCKCGACSIDGGNQYTRIGGDTHYINIVYEDGTEKLLANKDTQLNNNYSEIENKYDELIQKAKEYMKIITDYEHDINHMYDVVNYSKELLNSTTLDVDAEVCIISAYWHDVGRIKMNEGHEKLSAQMLKEEMINSGYDNQFISKCYLAIENHKWNMQPTTTEGLIVKDADKLAWIGMGRWTSCLKNNQNLDSIIRLLPKLRNEILYFNESKKIYDRDIVKLVELLYNDNLRKEE